MLRHQQRIVNVFTQPVGHDIRRILHQLVGAVGDALRHTGDVGRTRPRDAAPARQHLVARAGVVVDELGAEQVQRGDGGARVDVRRHVLRQLERDAHALHALEPHARDPALLHAGDEDGIALL